jgi:hypothetical protein
MSRREKGTFCSRKRLRTDFLSTLLTGVILITGGTVIAVYLKLCFYTYRLRRKRQNYFSRFLHFSGNLLSEDF